MLCVTKNGALLSKKRPPIILLFDQYVLVSVCLSPQGNELKLVAPLRAHFDTDTSYNTPASQCVEIIEGVHTLNIRNTGTYCYFDSTGTAASQQVEIIYMINAISYTT